MKFTKMHAQENDYICIEKSECEEKEVSSMAAILCDRHKGIGADGLLLVCPSQKAMYGMRIFNADGSEAEMCGNGIRCFAKYVYEKKRPKHSCFSIETISGVHMVWVLEKNNQVEQVTVDMGYPRLNVHSIPMISTKDIVIKEPVYLEGESVEVTGVSMGNPHIVVFVSRLEICPVQKYGAALETHTNFPNRTNIEFCQVNSRTEIAVRVWERGVGETWSCGTGACAAVVAAVLNDETDRRVKVLQKGGSLEIEWEESTNRVYLTGEVTKVFEGEVLWE